jgi:hypothetical protein
LSGSEEFQDSLFIRGEASDFSHDVSDERNSFAEDSLLSGRKGSDALARYGLGDETLVKTE